MSWLDEPGEDEVLVHSRAIRLPGPLPDVAGLRPWSAPARDRYGDLLLASTGWNPVTRHPAGAGLPRPGVDDPAAVPHPGGPVSHRRTAGGRAGAMSWRGTRPAWRHLGVLTTDRCRTLRRRVDLVLNPLPGMEQYVG